MIGKYKYKSMPSYPQLSKLDAQLWERFLIKYPDKFDSVDYDVRLGPRTHFKGIIPKNVHFDGVWNTLWRIDVIAYKSNEIHIIELKPGAKSGAIGQLICYDILYRNQYTNVSKIHLSLITDFIRPQLKFCADTLDIKLYTV